jgi:hypothetical protein
MAGRFHKHQLSMCKGEKLVLGLTVNYVWRCGWLTDVHLRVLLSVCPPRVDRPKGKAGQSCNYVVLVEVGGHDPVKCGCSGYLQRHLWDRGACNIISISHTCMIASDLRWAIQCMEVS